MPLLGNKSSGAIFDTFVCRSHQHFLSKTYLYYLQHKINKLQHYGLSTLANAYIYIVNYSCTNSSSTCVHYTYPNKSHTIISSCRLSKLKCESHSSK